MSVCKNGSQTPRIERDFRFEAGFDAQPRPLQHGFLAKLAAGVRMQWRSRTPPGRGPCHFQGRGNGGIGRYGLADERSTLGGRSWRRSRSNVGTQKTLFDFDSDKGKQGGRALF